MQNEVKSDSISKLISQFENFHLKQDILLQFLTPFFSKKIICDDIVD